MSNPTNGHGARATTDHESGGRHGRSLTPSSPTGRGRIGARSRRDFHGKPNPRSERARVGDPGPSRAAVAPFEDLLVHDPERLVRTVMDAGPVYFGTDDNALDAALTLGRYALVLGGCPRS